MKLTTLALALAATAMLHGPAMAQEPAQALDAFHAALVAGDKDKVTDTLDPQVAIYEGGHVERSLAEYASAHLGSDMKFSAAVKRKVLSQKVRESGNLATVWSETESQGTYAGRTIKMKGVETAVLEKTDGKWRIVHIHWSSRNG